MIKGISYWSLREGGAGTHPIDRALADARDAGFDALELAIGTEGVLHVETSQAECQAMREQIDASGLVVETLATGMSWRTNPLSDDEATRRRAVELHRAALQRAAWLGCDAMLYVPGVVNSPISSDRVRYDRALGRARDAVEQLLETAEDVGVDLCVENVWNGMFYSPLELIEFVDRFDSDRLGVYFDVGNLLGYHQHPPHWIELLGPRIKRVHVKDYDQSVGGLKGFCGLLEGDVPWPETMAALRDIGYDRTIVAEMMPWDETLLQRTSTAMDQILAM